MIAIVHAGGSKIAPSRSASSLIGLLGAGGFFLGQVLSKTDPLYALFLSLALACGWMGWLACGGFRTVSGLCVADLLFRTLLFGPIVKIFLWEPGESGMVAPKETALVLLLGMASLAGAGFLAKRFGGRRPWVPTVDHVEVLRWTTVVAYILGLLGMGVAARVGSSGRVLVLASGISLAQVTGTAYTIRSSGGQRSLSIFSLLPLGTGILFGALEFSKEGLLTPLLLWGLTGVSFGFRFRGRHLLCGLLLVWLIQNVAMPLAQYGRTLRPQDLSLGEHDWFGRQWEGMAFVVRQLFSQEGRAEIKEGLNRDWFASGLDSYFGSHTVSPLVGRLAFTAYVDRLVGATLVTGTSGWLTLESIWKNLLPGFRPENEKLIGASANHVGRKAGLLAESDLTTGASCGPIADAFSSFSWAGVLWIPFVLYFVWFSLWNRALGTIEKNPWGVYAFGILHHTFVEGTVDMVARQITRTLPETLILYFILSRIVSLLVSKKDLVSSKSDLTKKVGTTQIKCG